MTLYTVYCLYLNIWIASSKEAGKPENFRILAANEQLVLDMKSEHITADSLLFIQNNTEYKGEVDIMVI